MEKYMGIKTLMAMPKEREGELPRIEIEKTVFIVDIKRHEFIQADNPGNRIPMGAVKEEMGFHHFFYDTTTRTMYLGDTGKAAGIPVHVKMVIVPPLKKLDPVGLAMRQGLSQDYYKGQQQHTLVCLQAMGRTKTIKNRTGKKPRL